MPLYYIDASTPELFQKSKKFEKFSRATLIISNTLSKNTDFDMLVFTTETKEEVMEILDSYKNKAKPEGEYTRGLFARGVE